MLYVAGPALCRRGRVEGVDSLVSFVESCVLRASETLVRGVEADASNSSENEPATSMFDNADDSAEVERVIETRAGSMFDLAVVREQKKRSVSRDTRRDAESRGAAG